MIKKTYLLVKHFQTRYIILTKLVIIDLKTMVTIIKIKVCKLLLHWYDSNLKKLY